MVNSGRTNAENGCNTRGESGDSVRDLSTMRVEIAERDFYRLPPRTQDLIRHYGERLVCRRDTFTFEIAEYRWNEIMNPGGD